MAHWKRPRRRVKSRRERDENACDFCGVHVPENDEIVFGTYGPCLIPGWQAIAMLRDDIDDGEPLVVWGVSMGRVCQSCNATLVDSYRENIYRIMALEGAKPMRTIGAGRPLPVKDVEAMLASRKLIGVAVPEGHLIENERVAGMFDALLPRDAEAEFAELIDRYFTDGVLDDEEEDA